MSSPIRLPGGVVTGCGPVLLSPLGVSLKPLGSLKSGPGYAYGFGIPPIDG